MSGRRHSLDLQYGRCARLYFWRVSIAITPDGGWVTYAAAFTFAKPKTNNGGRGRDYLRDDNKRGRRRGRADTPDATALGTAVLLFITCARGRPCGYRHAQTLAVRAYVLTCLRARSPIRRPMS